MAPFVNTNFGTDPSVHPGTSFGDNGVRFTTGGRLSFSPNSVRPPSGDVFVTGVTVKKEPVGIMIGRDKSLVPLSSTDGRYKSSVYEGQPSSGSRLFPVLSLTSQEKGFVVPGTIF